MKSTHVVAFFAIVVITSTRLYGMDFLNDPFFKQLAGELDSMFGTGPMDDAPAPAKPATPFGGGFGAKAPAAGASAIKKDADTLSTPAVADAAKDLKTLFLENLEQPKAKAGTFGAPQKQTKIIISKKRVQAYNLYMGDLVKKTRLMERIVASNPARTFEHRFLVTYDEVINFVDKIETIHQLILSKKMYLRSFFGQSMQKTREQIVALMPKIDATLLKLRPLLIKEESLDDDISRMQQAAKSKPTKKKAPQQGKKIANKPGVPRKISRALQPPKTFGWPGNAKSPIKKLPQKKPQVKKTAPASQPRTAAPFPADFSLKKFMHEKGVS